MTENDQDNKNKEPLSNRDKIWIATLIVGAVFGLWKTALENLGTFDEGTITYNILNFIFKGGFVLIASALIIIIPFILAILPAWLIREGIKGLQIARNKFEKALLIFSLAFFAFIWFLLLIPLGYMFFKFDIILPAFFERIFNGI